MEADALIEENYDLVETVSRDVIRRCRFRPHLWDEVRSAAGLALVLAARRFDPERSTAEPRLYLRKKMFFIVIDELRSRNGRKGSVRYEKDIHTVSLNRISSSHDHDDGDEMGEQIEDESAQLPFEKVGDLDEIRDFLDSLPSDRQREIALRLIAGETRAAVGEHFGVTESRISQIATRMGRIRFGAEDRPKKEAKCRPKSNSLLVSWR